MNDPEIPGTYVFDLALSRRGYQLNKMGYSLRRPDNRAAFLADPAGYMRSYAVSEEQIAAVQARDWLACVRLGGNAYLMMRIGATVGQGLYHQGAQERGESYEEFLATRGVPEAT